MGQQGFDMSRLTMGQKGLLVTGALFFIDLFLPWETVDLGVFGGGSAGGFNGIGVIAGILVIALLVWEGLAIAGVNLNMNVSTALISAAVGGAVVLFGLIRAVIAITRQFTNPGFGAWLGIILLLAMAYASWVRWGESKTAGTGTPPPAPPA